MVTKTVSSYEKNTRIKRQYLIKRKTSALLPYFYNGYEYTKVIEGRHTFLVSQSPQEIVEQSFLEIYSNLKHATQRSRLILKSGYNLPVILSPLDNIVLIKCKAYDGQGLAWLVSSHIKDIQPHQSKQTTVYIKGGGSFNVRVKTKQLQMQRSHAAFLLDELLKAFKREPEPQTSQEEQETDSLKDLTIDEDDRKD